MLIDHIWLYDLNIIPTLNNSCTLIELPYPFNINSDIWTIHDLGRHGLTYILDQQVQQMPMRYEL